MKDLVTGNIYNDNNTLANLERILLIADAGINIVSGLFLIFTPGLSVPTTLSVGIELATAIIHSETFAYAANNSHSPLDFLQNLYTAFQLGRKR